MVNHYFQSSFEKDCKPVLRALLQGRHATEGGNAPDNARMRKYRPHSGTALFYSLERPTLICVLLLGLILIQSCSKPVETYTQPEATPVATESVLHEPITPIPLNLKFDPDKAALGKLLFHDRRLSKDNSISCASCHAFDKGGTDQRAHSVGVNGAEGTLNAPTVFNSQFNFNQFWDGRAHSLIDQIDSPLESSIEMSTTWEEIVAKLNADSEFSDRFRRTYPEGIRPQTIRDAIVQFELTLNTPNSKFDRYLRGDQNALTQEEKLGYEKFKSYGCVSCHQGVNVGGNMFETLGIMSDYFGERGHITESDYGRFNVTGKEKDRFVFKVPSLRNVALTAPYFHDGSVTKLEDAVSIMGKYQLGRDLSVNEVEQIIKFLNCLTGEYEGKPL